MAITPIAVKSIKLNSSSVNMEVGKTYTLYVTITPSNATQRSLVFSSANNNIVTVHKNGMIKGIKPGKTVITVTSVSNKKALAKCNVTVSKAKPPVTLTYFTEDPEYNTTTETPVYKEIVKETGITLHFIYGDDIKLKSLIAGNSLPDIVNTGIDQSGTTVKSMITAKEIIPLDNLMKSNGKNYLKHAQAAVDYLKSNSPDGKCYVLSTGITSKSTNPNYNAWGGIYTRFDLYKQMGAPTMHNEDDYIKMLKQMMTKFPNAPDGKKAYGFSTWTDWGMWPFTTMMASMYNYDSIGNNQGCTVPGYQACSTYLDTNSYFWKCINFLFKCNQAGVLDPASLTQ
jgi:putative aldouronate transport system substrate-binding protein